MRGKEPTNIPEQVFNIIHNIINGSNTNVPFDRGIASLLSNNANILDCNRTNLLAIAIQRHGETHENVKKMVEKFEITQEQFREAQVVAGRIVDDVATTEIAALDEEAAPEEPAPAPKVPERSIWDAVRDNNDDLEQIANKDNIDLRDSDNFTPIQIAAMNGLKKAVKILHKKGANTEGLDIAALIGDNQEVIDYLTQEAKLFTIEALTFKAASNDKYTSTLGKLLVKLPNGVEIYLCDEGLNALHVATKKGAKKNIEQTIESGINVESKTKDGFTALQISVLESKPTSFTTLVNKQADVFVEEPTTGANILHLAARTGNKIMADTIMTLDVAPGLAKGKDSTGQNPIHTAASLGHSDVMGAILTKLLDAQKDAVVNATDGNGKSVLSVAKDTTIRELLEQHGAKEPADVVEEVTPPHTPTPHKSAPSTPQHQIKVATVPPTPASAMKLPISVDAEILSPLTTLVNAMCNNDQEGVKKALGSVSDPRALLQTKLTMTSASIERSTNNDMQDVTVLQLAHALGQQSTLALRAMTDVWLDKNWYALTEAIRNSNSTALTTLLTCHPHLKEIKFNIADSKTSNCAGFLIDSADNGQSIWVNFNSSQNTSTLLHIAAILGSNENIVDVILQQEVPINAQDIAGYTAMHYAVQSNNKSMVIKLKTSNSDLSIVSCGVNETPADLAAYLNKTDIYETLIGNTAPSHTHLVKAIKGKASETFDKIIKKNPSLLNACYTRDKTNILHHIAKDGTTAMASKTNEHNHDIFNKLVILKDAHKNIPLHFAGTRDKTTYKAFFDLLSHHDKTVMKGGFFGFGKKQAVEKEDISFWENDQFQTPEQVYIQHHASELAGEA